ncbi:MAG: hypothetical protein AAGE65_05125 [Planctomycetota bacterium]
MIDVVGKQRFADRSPHPASREQEARAAFHVGNAAMDPESERLTPDVALHQL